MRHQAARRSCGAHTLVEEMKHICLKPDVFPLTFHFLFGKWDRKEAQKKVGVPKGEVLDNPKAAARCWDRGCHQIIWMPSKKKATNKELPLLVHEITHATLHAGAEIGFTDCDAGAEFYAYMAQWLIEEVLRKLRKEDKLTTESKNTRF